MDNNFHLFLEDLLIVLELIFRNPMFFKNEVKFFKYKPLKIQVNHLLVLVLLEVFLDQRIIGYLKGILLYEILVSKGKQHSENLFEGIIRIVLLIRYLSLFHQEVARNS